MADMFYGCDNFEGKTLNKWNISKLKSNINKKKIFKGCKSLPNWAK